jgi:hypothetical protein
MQMSNLSNRVKVISPTTRSRSRTTTGASVGTAKWPESGLAAPSSAPGGGQEDDCRIGLWSGHLNCVKVASRPWAAFMGPTAGGARSAEGNSPAY